MHKSKRLEVVRLDIRKGGYCSVHRHRERDNIFIWDTGAFLVRLYATEGDDIHGSPASELPMATYLLPDYDREMFVEAGVIHSFLALSDCVVVEYSTPTDGAFRLDDADIERFTLGGIEASSSPDDRRRIRER